jgi:hypothetical protein
MRAKLGIMGAVILLAVTVASAQEQARVLIQNDMYCSGIVSDEPVPTSTILITGDFANTLTTFGQGDYVYINKGTSQGVMAGDEFIVVRAAACESSWRKKTPPPRKCRTPAAICSVETSCCRSPIAPLQC